MMMIRLNPRGRRRWVQAAAICSAITAQAIEPSDFLLFSRDPFSLRPQLDIVEQYNDNIFYADKNKADDFITIIAPGLRFLVGEDLPEANHFDLAYTFEDYIYADNSSQDAMQHKVAAELRYAWQRVTLEGLDRLEFLSSALGGGFSLTGTKVDRMVGFDNYRLDYKFGERTGVYGEVQHSSVDYDTDLQLFDSRTISGTFGFQYIYSADTRFFGEAYYGVTELDNNQPNSGELPGTTFVGGFLGVRGNFTEKLRGMVKAGYVVSTFSGGETGTGVDKDAGQAPVVEATLTYQFSERTTANLTYSRRQQVSVQYVRSAYTMDAVGINATHVIGSTGRLRADAGVNYTMYDYDSSAAFREGRMDNNLRIDAGVSYYFRPWLSTRLQYGHERYSSDFASVVDYNVNRVTLVLAIGY